MKICRINIACNALVNKGRGNARIEERARNRAPSRCFNFFAVVNPMFLGDRTVGVRRDGRSIDPEIEGGWKHRGCGAVEALRHELGIGRVSGLIGAMDSMNSRHSNG